MYVISGVTGHTGKVAAETLLSRGSGSGSSCATRRRARRSRRAGPRWRSPISATQRRWRGRSPGEGRLRAATAEPGGAGRVRLAGGAARGVPLGGGGSRAAAPGVPVVDRREPAVRDRADRRGPPRRAGAARAARTRATFVRRVTSTRTSRASLGTLGEGKLVTFFPPDFPLPSAATRDIGALAATLLLGGPTEDGARGRARLARDAERDAADAIGLITGHQPALVALPATEQAATLRGLGVPPPVAALFQEMTTGFIDGRIAWEPGRRHVRVADVDRGGAARAAVSAASAVIGRRSRTGGAGCDVMRRRVVGPSAWRDRWRICSASSRHPEVGQARPWSGGEPTPSPSSARRWPRRAQGNPGGAGGRCAASRRCVHFDRLAYSSSSHWMPSSICSSLLEIIRSVGIGDRRGVPVSGRSSANSCRDTTFTNMCVHSRRPSRCCRWSCSRQPTPRPSLAAHSGSRPPGTRSPSGDRR